MKKELYIVLSHTNTTIGKGIRFFTNYTYNHISISSNTNLQPLYSFARYHYSCPLAGGFIEESLLRYLNQKSSTPVRIYSIPITDKQHQIFNTIIKSYQKESSKCIYNTFGVLCGDNFTSKYKHTCLSFAISILKDCDILSSDMHVKSIKALADILSIYPHTEIQLGYQQVINCTWGNDTYNQKLSFLQIIKNTFLHFKKLIFSAN